MINRRDRNGRIHKAVQDHYTLVAKNGDLSFKFEPNTLLRGQSLIDTARCLRAHRIYGKDQLHGLPDDVVFASTGCSNPVALSYLQLGETVVDLGSGGGIDAFLAAREVGRRGSVVGIDMTIAMVEIARNNAQKLCTENVIFKLAPIEAIPMSDSTADVIISNCVIALAPDKDIVFREAYRVLRPGGRLLISDLVMIERLPVKAVSDAREWVAGFDGADDQDTYTERLSDAGFIVTDVIKNDPVQSFGDLSRLSRLRSFSFLATKLIDEVL